MAIVLIIINCFVGMIEGTLIKKYNSKHSEGGFLFTGIVSLFSMLFFLITDRNGLEFPPEIWIYAVPAGICFCSASFFTYVALGCGSFALTMLVLSYPLVFKIVYGLAFLKEPGSVFTYVGIVLVLISIYFIKSEGNESGVKKTVTPFWVLAMVISIFGCGFYGVLVKMQQVRFKDAYSNEFMIICLAISAAVLITVGLYHDRGKIMHILRCGGIYAALAGFSNGATNLLSLIVQTMMPISLLAPLNVGIGNLVKVLISLFIFKEKLNRNQIIGIVLGTAALILFSIR